MHSNRKLLVSLLACLILTGTLPSYAWAKDANPGRELWSHLGSIYINSGSIDTGDASEVEIMLKSAIDHSARTWGENSNEALHATLELLKLYRMQARFSEMKPYIARVASVFPKLDAESKFHFSPQIVDLSKELLNKDRVEAKNLLAAIVNEINSEERLSNDFNLRNKLWEICEAYQGKNDSASAEMIARALLFACEHQQPINEVEVASARFKLAEALKNDHRAALELASMALECEEKLYGEASDKSVRTLILLCSLYIATSRTAEAVRISEKLSSALEQSYQGVDRSLLCNEILELCRSFAQKGEEKPVVRLFAAALDIDHTNRFHEFDTTLTFISQSPIAKKSPDRVETLFLKWQQRAEKMTSSLDSCDAGQVLVSMTRHFIQKGQFDKVDSRLAKLSKVKNDNSVNEMILLLQEIETTPNTVLKERICSFLADSSNLSVIGKRQVAYFKAKLAGFYVNNGKVKEARKTLRQCTVMLKESLPIDCQDLAYEYQTLFDRYSKEGRLQEAQTLTNGLSGYCFDRNILVRVAKGFSTLSQYRENLGDTEKAEALIARSLAVSDKYDSKHSHAYADTLSRHSLLLRRLGQIDLAVEREKQAMELRQDLKRLGINRYG